MECVFDKCEFWNGVGLGIISGLVASVMFTILYHWVREHFYFKKRFGKLSGEYRGFGYKVDNPGELNDKPISNATIKHTAENRLEIMVTHNNLTWVGEITMSSLKFGAIVFQYKNKEAKHFFGFKRCIVEDDFNTIIVIGEEGYGKEVFKRV
jgi:hypothetical protein